VNPTEVLLRRLAAGDECCNLAIVPDRRPEPVALDGVTRALVQLSALLVADAATESLRWAVDVAAGLGAGDVSVLQVLLTAAPTAGAAQVVASAPRLALALDLDVES
jgi:hypothetical protein